MSDSVKAVNGSHCIIGNPYIDSLPEESRDFIVAQMKDGSVIGGALSVNTIHNTTFWFLAEDFCGAECMDTSFTDGTEYDPRTKVFIRGKSSPVITYMTITTLFENLNKAKEWSKKPT